MGALHQGHLALIKHGHQLCSGTPHALIVSIFVNPTQFNSPKDFKFYPRTLPKDLSLLRHCKVDYVFTPSAAMMYPEGAETCVEPGALAQYLCGATRPGHFRGVITIVAKLFHIVQPDFAIFGEKDFQQLAIIRQMAKDLNFPVQIIGHPTVRESDGLAMSSRNARLSPEGRRRALAVVQGLREAKRLTSSGVRNVTRLKKAVRHILQEKGKIDYLELVDVQTLRPVKTIKQKTLLAIAIFIDEVRLIDNCLLP